MRHREPAICLKVTDYSETSQVTVFLTRDHGIVRLIAKGTKRSKSKSGGAVDIFSEGDLLYTLKNPDMLGTLMEFHETVSHTPLRKDSARLNISLYALELAGTVVPEGDPHPEIFELLDRTLRRLGEDDAPLRPVLAYYQKRILTHTGLLAEFRRCVSCGIEQCTHFSGSVGGLLCTECGRGQSEKIPAGPEEIRAMGLLIDAEAGKKVEMTDKLAAAAIRLMDYHISCQLSRQLRMSKYVVN